MKINWINNKSINFDEIKNLLSLCVEKNHFTNNGPLIQILKESIRTQLKIDESKEIYPVCNATIALWLAVSAIEVVNKKSLRWATQAFTFPSSAQGILKDVLIVDIDFEGGLDLSNNLENDVDGIIVTNLFGNIVDISKYENWCKKHGKYLIFDNAATCYTIYNSKNSLNYGNASIISFHHTKQIGFGEGGAIIMDKDFIHECKKLANFGIDNSNPNFEWHRLGGNYKMSELSAAYIISYFKNFTIHYQKVKSLIQYFISKTKNFNKFKLFPNFGQDAYLFCIAILYTDYKDSLIAEKKLLEQQIYCRKYYNPLIKTPVAMDFYNKILCIPIHYDVEEIQLDVIINLL